MVRCRFSIRLKIDEIDLNNMVEKKTYRLSGGMFDRDEESLSVKRLFFLSVEGVGTEPSYFNRLNRSLKDLGVDDVMIHVLKHPNDGLSAPTDVYALLEECHALRAENHLLPLPALAKLRENFTDEEIRDIMDDKEVCEEKRKQFHDILLKLGVNFDYRKYIQAIPSSNDCFAVVIDRDQHSHTRECLEEIAGKCREKSFVVCLTNPCFEFWLLLHLVDERVLSTNDECAKILENKKLSKKHTYVSKRVWDIARHAKYIPGRVFEKSYKPNIQRAMTAAKCFATKFEDVLDGPGTTILDLLESVFKV